MISFSIFSEKCHSVFLERERGKITKFRRLARLGRRFKKEFQNTMGALPKNEWKTKFRPYWRRGKSYRPISTTKPTVENKPWLARWPFFIYLNFHIPHCLYGKSYFWVSTPLNVRNIWFPRRHEHVEKPHSKKNSGEKPKIKSHYVVLYANPERSRRFRACFGNSKLTSMNRLAERFQALHALRASKRAIVHVSSCCSPGGVNWRQKKKDSRT